MYTGHLVAQFDSGRTIARLSVVLSSLNLEKIAGLAAPV